MKVELKTPDAAIGERAVRIDVIDARPLVQLAALMDAPMEPPRAGDAILPGRHWLYFTAAVPRSGLKEDGIAKKTAAVPDVEGGRRMWAGGRTEFLRPLTVGSSVRRDTEVIATSKKSGKSGDLVFVTVRNQISDEKGVAITEEQDFLYRDPANIKGSLLIQRPAPQDAQWTAHFTPDLVMLFRYSAITFNSHRMHFDREYARQMDGYTGAVVHGPLLATMLMDQCAREQGRAVRRLAYRGVSPLFDGSPAVLCGRMDGPHRARAWAATADGRLALEAEIDFVEGASA
ncbi:MAG: MaoC family dehydratase N-terminal domain-containing protein [Pseudomonadota bacterium]